MNVTINTDASFWQNGDQSKKLGGFAFWIKTDSFTYKGSGIIKDPENANDCELKAICNSLYLLKKNKDLININHLYINTDSMNSIWKIDSKEKDEVTRLIIDIIKSFGVKKLHLRHVKAHQHTRTKRNFVNQWCDDMAKIEMRKQRVNV